jgi:hypothetical protein
VEGTDLYFMLLDLGHPAWSFVGATATAVLASCGSALAHIHGASERASAGASRDAFKRMRSVASSLWLRPSVVSGAELQPVVGFGDIGPHQFRITDAGQIWVLDPPTDPAPALPHEDVATFLFGIDKLLGAASGVRTRSRHATRTALREAFLEGYGRAGVIDPRRAVDRWLLRLFDTKMAAGTARRRIHERELLDTGRMLLRYAAGQLWLRWHRPRPRG